LAKIILEAEVDVELRVWEGMWHVFEYYQEIPESTQSLKEISSFFEKTF
jgi:monoterpene epsilon-lactone hydrolase